MKFSENPLINQIKLSVKPLLNQTFGQIPYPPPLQSPDQAKCAVRNIDHPPLTLTEKPFYLPFALKLTGF